MSGKSLAMAYVPWQSWKDIYDFDKGFCIGTIFSELNKPFEGGKR
ncbi:MAG: spore coat associated protein CotJA [Lachnospiraceae bacterium]|nr:spore coat associated protein CotJA [Lachnospiraceae bacterium]MDE6252566.1 spore coat associated protein CotJA [Lachnospiraceae bacterium]